MVSKWTRTALKRNGSAVTSNGHGVTSSGYGVTDMLPLLVEIKDGWCCCRPKTPL
jgi:hypothetical protein